MIGLLTALGLSRRIAARLAPWVAGALAIALLVALALIWDYFDDKKAVRADRLEANAGALETQTRAEIAAATARARDMVTNDRQTGEFDDAIHSPRPGDSGDPAVRLACQQLRNDGQDTAAIPECGGR